MTEKPISGYRAREVGGLMIPCDERVALPTEVVIKRVHDWLLDSDIEFMEVVNGANTRPNDFVMIVDDEGRDRQLPWNPRAQFLSGYPIQAPIVGNALFFSMDWVDDGLDIVNLTDKAKTWLLDPARAMEYMAWTEAAEIRDYASEYLMRYPQRPPVYPKREG